jgi:hypothetical protein
MAGIIEGSAESDAKISAWTEGRSDEMFRKKVYAVAFHKFSGTAKYLSNQYACRVVIDDVEYKSAANAYYSLFFSDRGIKERIANITPHIAGKALSQKVSSGEWTADTPLTPEDMSKLRTVVRLKFEQNEDLVQQLTSSTLFNFPGAYEDIKRRTLKKLGVGTIHTNLSNGKLALATVLVELYDHYTGENTFSKRTNVGNPFRDV